MYCPGNCLVTPASCPLIILWKTSVVLQGQIRGQGGGEEIRQDGKKHNTPLPMRIILPSQPQPSSPSPSLILSPVPAGSATCYFLTSDGQLPKAATSWQRPLHPSRQKERRGALWKEEKVVQVSYCGATAIYKTGLATKEAEKLWVGPVTPAWQGSFVLPCYGWIVQHIGLAATATVFFPT